MKHLSEMFSCLAVVGLRPSSRQGCLEPDCRRLRLPIYRAEDVIVIVPKLNTQHQRQKTVIQSLKLPFMVCCWLKLVSVLSELSAFCGTCFEICCRIKCVLIHIPKPASLCWFRYQFECTA
ncbi:MAG: hypothetical protein LBJ00_01865 [Planctomycetaceae bacterium]|nr:hypothetical protein [Planctomycetaceae bacterium]